MFILLHVRVTLSSYNVLFILGHKHLRTMHCVESKKGCKFICWKVEGELQLSTEDLLDVLLYLVNLCVEIKAKLSESFILFGAEFKLL